MGELHICRACGREIAQGAPFCIYCGASFVQGEPSQTPAASRPSGRLNLTNRQQTTNLLVFVAAAVTMVVLAANLSGCRDDKSEGDKVAQSSPDAENLNDADYLSNHYQSPADSECSHGADEYLRSIAKYDFAWDQTGMFEDKFDRYSTVVKQPGVLTVVSRKAKLQNGFGAFQHIQLFCDYDTQSMKVIDYRVIPADNEN